jgi:hypothetical protein
VLLTRSRLCPRASPGSSLHLHVLSTPPAFVLSQDQTLREELLGAGRSPHPSQRAVMDHVRHRVHRGAAIYDGSISGPPKRARRAEAWRPDRRIEPGRTPGRGSTQVRMLLSFQRPPRPAGKGTPSQEARPEACCRRRGPPSIARVPPRLQEGPTARRAPAERPGTVADRGAARRELARPPAGAPAEPGERARRAGRAGRPRLPATPAPAPTRSALGGGRRSRRGRSAARCPGRARLRRSGSSRSGR